MYAGFAWSETLPALLAWFLVYGFYFGFAEGTEKALVADLAPPSRRGFAFGVYTAVQGIGALAASILFGLIWNAYGAALAFGVGAALALVAWFLLYGFYFGFAKGTEKALVADLAPAERRGFAFGVYDAVQGLGALAASVVFGAIWNAYGAAAAFGLGAALALAATALLFASVPRRIIVTSR